MSKIIRGAKINRQPVQIKINLPFIRDIAPGDGASETSDVIPEVEETPETPVIDVAEYIARAEAEAQSIIAEAHNIVAEAQEHAQQIISEAEQTAIQLKDEAVNSGKAEGHALGHQQGVEQGYQEMAVLLEQAAQIVDYAKNERKEILDKCEREVLELALSVAARVIHTEVTINNDVVLAVVKDAIQKAKDQELIIRINPADFETVTREKQTLQAILRRETGMEIRGDIGVEVGGCVIETDYGTIDARIDTQLEGIKNALLGVVKHG